MIIILYSYTWTENYHLISYVYILYLIHTVFMHITHTLTTHTLTIHTPHIYTPIIILTPHPTGQVQPRPCGQHDHPVDRPAGPDGQGHQHLRYESKIHTRLYD